MIKNKNKTGGNKMNTYKKYCPNVFVAQCEEKHEKGETVTITTRYGKENKHIIHNFLGYTGTKEAPLYCYSITRADGFNNQERAMNKVDKLNGYASNAKKRSDDCYNKSNLSEEATGIPFGQPVLVGHHSERAHRKTIEKAKNAMRKSIEEDKKVTDYQNRIKYWEKMSNTVNLSMPESLEFFNTQLEEAITYHKGLKDGSIKRGHSFSLTYANKKVNDLKNKCKFAAKLWA